LGSIRYIGSKARIATSILDLIPARSGARFVDLFCGSGAVSRAAAERGWSVYANDQLNCAAILTEGQLVAPFEVPFRQLGGYLEAVRQLNEAAQIDGFIFREYSPSGLSHSGHERRYFTTDNARRIDGMRLQIQRWGTDGLVTPTEKRLLLADLLEAANGVASTAGTYGCFMRQWIPRSMADISLVGRELLPRRNRYAIETMDAFAVTVRRDDVLYLDPPYTRRQYAAYYHVLETIAQGDEPEVSGVTGLRPWRHLSSPFCHKRHALNALIHLLRQTPANRVFISYSDQGHIQLSDALAALRALGRVELHSVREIGRYRPNRKAAAASSSVSEYLVELHPRLVEQLPDSLATPIGSVQDA